MALLSPSHLGDVFLRIYVYLIEAHQLLSWWKYTFISHIIITTNLKIKVEQFFVFLQIIHSNGGKKS